MEQTFEAEESHTVEMGDYTRLSLKNTNGNVVVEGCEGETLTLRAVKKVKAGSGEEGRERLNALRVAVSTERPVLGIATDDSELRPKGGYSVDYTVRLPKRMAPTLETENGNVTVSGTGAETAVRSRNGNVHASRIEGRAGVGTTNGNVHAEDVTGPLEAHTVNGNVRACRVQGPSEGRTCNGNVHLIDVAGPTSGSATNGNIQATLTEWRPGHEARLQTLNGNVSLALPESASAQIAASVRNGRVGCELAVAASAQTRTRLEGTLGSGEGVIDLRATNGNVRVQKAS